MNLLQSDHSTLTLEQWNHLSNLSHCYDENSGMSIAIHFMNEQHILPIKLRYKSARLWDFIGALVDTAHLLYEKNNDFLTLDTHDRSILLHHTIKYVGGLSSHFICRRIELLDSPICLQSLESIAGKNIIAAAKQIYNLSNFDSVFMKLFVALLAFSTLNYTVYSKLNSNNLKNLKQVLHIQDTYAELAWRYLLYKYNHNQAVVCFSNVLRCLFILNGIMVDAYEREVEQIIKLIDNAAQQTEQSLCLGE